MAAHTKTLTVTIVTSGADPLKISESERGLIEDAIEAAVQEHVDLTDGYSRIHDVKAVIIEVEGGTV